MEKTDRSATLHKNDIPKVPGHFTGDSLRLLYLVELMDGIGNREFHEGAAMYAEDAGKDEPGDAEYLRAVRDLLDESMRESGWPLP